MIDTTSTPGSQGTGLCERPTQRGPIQIPVASISVVVPKYVLRKAVWMRVLAGLLLVGFYPIILITMLLVRLTSPGPALFRQTRLGKDGRHFDILKIRTMYGDAEELSGPVLCQPGDSRITPIGRLLRLLHLDELPQLINVVRGEMCLVGPRPERPEIISLHRLNEVVPGFAERTKVLPGVTGLAQINLPADQDAQSVIPKVQLDLQYIATASAMLDLRILLCTAMRMLGVRHGRAVKLFGLQRSTHPHRAAIDADAGHRYDRRPRREINGYHGRHGNGASLRTVEAAINSLDGDFEVENTVDLVSPLIDTAIPPTKPR